MRSSPDALKSSPVPWMPAEFGEPASRRAAGKNTSRPEDSFGFQPLFGDAPQRPAAANSPHSENPAAHYQDTAAQNQPAEQDNPVASSPAGHSRAWVPGEITPHRSSQAGNKFDAQMIAAVREAAYQAMRETSVDAARQEADEILAQARLQADALLHQAQQTVEDARQCARAEAIAEAQAKTESLVLMATQVVKEVSEWQAYMFGLSESQVIGLVKDIAGKLFGQGFVLNEDQLRHTYERALNEAKSLGDLRLRANPEDVAALNELWPAQQSALRGQKIELTPDKDIQRGGCYIDGQFGTVDGRLETQLHFVEDKLDETLTVVDSTEKAFITYRDEEAAL